MIACVGLGICLARHQLFPEGGAASARRRGKVTARFDGAIPVWGISELKSNAVGEQLMRCIRRPRLDPLTAPVYAEIGIVRYYEKAL